MDFTANKFYVILFSLFEALFTIFTLFVLANRPLFAATKQCKSAQKYLSTKLEIKSKQILIPYTFFSTPHRNSSSEGFGLKFRRL